MVFPTSGLANADETLAIAKAHHRGLVEAIARRQSARAESLAREHAFIGRHVLELALSDMAALRRVPGASLINVSMADSRSPAHPEGV
jgi:GntR family transcriptional regulator of vanillate catabolism